MSVTSLGILRLTQTSIGKKVIMAVTGLIGVAFVLGHMYGNLKVFFGEEEFAAYAIGLRELGEPIFTHSEPLWLVRLVLLAAVVLHVWAAWSLSRESQRARQVQYAQYKTLKTNLAALYMRVGGVILLIFLVFHLMHFTWGVPGIHPDFIWAESGAYHNLVVGLQSYAYLPAIFYIIAMVFLASHLYHGVWSMFQTLGLNNKDYTQALRWLALATAIIVAGGFAIVPLAVIIGLVK
jgi:succinate dehydrogenase / fumarate reductase cytochrome b subunit